MEMPGALQVVLKADRIGLVEDVWSAATCWTEWREVAGSHRKEDHPRREVAGCGGSSGQIQLSYHCSQPVMKWVKYDAMKSRLTLTSMPVSQ